MMVALAGIADPPAGIDVRRSPIRLGRPERRALPRRSIERFPSHPPAANVGG
jgi:hypothetical protein